MTKKLLVALSLDWLHLHHEDFTGQYGKFYAAYKNTEWYRKQKQDFEKSALKWAFKKLLKPNWKLP